MFLLKYLQLTRSRQCNVQPTRAPSVPALQPASCKQHGGHKKSGFYPGGMNDPVAITGTVYSALCWPSAKGFAYIVSLIITPPGGQRKQQRLGAVMQQRAPSHPASGLQSQSLHPSPQCRGWRLSLQDFSVTKTSSPLITDFITHETAGLGRRKIA